MIKKDDWVMVSGEGNECFKVIYITEKTVGLHSGCSEPMEKCTKIDKDTGIVKITKFYCPFGQLL